MHTTQFLALIADPVQAQGPDLTRYFAVLGGVALVLLLLAIGLKRLVANNSLGLGRHRKGMQVVEVLALGSRRQLAVVRCYDRTFALGLGEKNVSLVAELDAEMVQHEAAAQADAQTGARGWLKRNKAVVAPSLGASTPEPAPVQQAAAKTPVSAGSPDPFEALLDRAQAQLDARRVQQKRARAAQASTPAQALANDVDSAHHAGGLQELC